MVKLTIEDHANQKPKMSSSWWQYGRQLLKGTMILGAGFLGYVLLRGSWFSGEENTAANDANADLLSGSYSRMSRWLSANVETSALSYALGSRQLLAASPRTGEFVITHSSCDHELEFIVSDSTTDSAVRVMRSQCGHYAADLSYIGNYSYQSFLINAVGDIESMMVIPFTNATRIQAGLNFENGFLLTWYRETTDPVCLVNSDYLIRHYTGHTEAANFDDFEAFSWCYVNVSRIPGYISKSSDINVMLSPIGNSNHTFVAVYGAHPRYTHEYGLYNINNILHVRQYNISNGRMELQSHQVLADDYMGGGGLAHMSDGSAVVVWRGVHTPYADDEYTTGIYAQILDPEGVKTEPIYIANSKIFLQDDSLKFFGVFLEAYLSQDAPVVAALTTGDFIVVWEDVTEIQRPPISLFNSGRDYDNVILARRYSPEGIEQGEIFQVNTCLNSAIKPQVIETETGYLITWVYSCWLSDYCSTQIAGQRYDFTDHKIGNEFIIAGDSDGSDQLAKRTIVTLSGNPFLLWQTDANTLKGRIFSDESDFSKDSICSVSDPYNATGLILVILGGLVLTGAGIWGYRFCSSSRRKKVTEGAISTELQEQEEGQEEVSGVDVTAKIQLGVP